MLLCARAHRYLVILVVLSGSAAAAGTIPPAWPYTCDFGSYLLHVHPEVNYALHPDWLEIWERDRLGRGAFHATFGSSASDELILDARWTMNPELAPGLRLRQDIIWQERRHLPVDRLDLWLGLEWSVRMPFALVAQITPSRRKDELDLRLGGLWTSDDRTRYVQLLYVLQGMIHDEKDGRRGVTDVSPLGASWLLRLELGRWVLASQGHWVRRFERRYPEVWRSPILAAHRGASNEFTVRLRWRPASRTAVEAAWFQAEDAEAKQYRHHPELGDLTVYDHDYAGWYRLLSLRALWPLSDRWRLRGELHRLHRRSAAEGWRAFRYRRGETLPALFAEWSWSPRRTVELGYMGTFCDWRRLDRDIFRTPDERRGYADKVELALILGLAADASMKLSLSHEVSRQRFGGGSLRLLTGF